MRMIIKVLKRAGNVLLVLLSFFLFYITFVFGLRWIIFISFLPLFISLKQSKTKKEAFCLGLFFGVMYFSLALFWMTNISWILFAASVVLEAVYIGVFSLGLAFVCRGERRAFFYLFFVPGLWVLLEVLRSSGFLGFPVGLAGYALTEILPMAQIASLLGVYGLSFLVIFINGLLFYVLQKNVSNKKKVRWLLFGIIIILSSSLWGQKELGKSCQKNQIKVSIIQPNISSKQKWDLSFIDAIITKHEDLSRSVLVDHPDLIIWPETAVPCFLFHEKRKDILDRIKTFAAEINVPMLTGSQDFKLDDKGGKHAYNIAVLFMPDSGAVEQYAKMKLVPFMEKAPFRFLIPFLRKMGLPSIFEPGGKHTIFKVGDVHFSSIICFEGLFPSLVRQFVKKGAEVVINITNDAPSLGKMKFYYTINAQMLKVRAIENRRSFVRAANDGVSSVIDPFGRALKAIEPFEEGALTVFVPLNQQSSYYTRNPHLMVSLSFLFFSLGLGLKSLIKIRIINKQFKHV